MRYDTPLDDVFLNRSHVRVLRALHHMPEGLRASGREIARRAGITHPTALKALAVLADVGLVTVRRGPISDEYELDRDHVLADRIADLYRTEEDVGGELLLFLRHQLLARTDKIESASVFGSVVWGESTPTSDIDLAVVCAASDADEVEHALQDLADAVRRRFGNRLSPLITSKKMRNTRIWKQIEEKGVPLIRSGKAVTR